MPGLKKVLMNVSGILFVILMWELATAVFGWFKWIILPPPTDVFLALISMAADGELWMHASQSLIRVILGFAVAAIVAIPLGVAMGWIPAVSHIVDPIVELLRPIPPIAWIGLALLWFGIGIQSAVFLVFIGAFFPILLNTISGVRSVEKKLIEVALTFGASDLEILKKVVLPAASPTIYTGLRVGMGIGWMCVVAAEMIAVDYGLGNLIIEASNFAQTDRVLVGMISIGVLGLIINLIFQIAGNRIFKWQKGISSSRL